MSLTQQLALGFGVASTSQNLVCALAGAALGMLVGVLPGIGALAAVAVLLPWLDALDLTSTFILLAALYGGAQYGGSVVRIRVSTLPGLSAPAAADGHAMVRKGRAGSALAAAGLGGIFAACIGVLAVSAVAVPVTELVAAFTSAEYVALLIFGLIGAVVLASGSWVKAVAMLLLGMLIAQIGTDEATATARFTFALPQLHGGVDMRVLAVGLFVFGDVITRLDRRWPAREILGRGVANAWPGRRDFLDAWRAVVRGTALGALLGVLPGSASLLASSAARSVEEARRPRPGEAAFGRGNIRGVAGPESARNAATQTSFLPMLLLGLPSNAVMALLIGVAVSKRVVPGPHLLATQSSLFWGLMASIWIGNAMLLLFNLPLAGLWARMLSVPYRAVYPAVVLLGCFGIQMLSHDPFDLYLATLFGVGAFVFHKLDCPLSPLLLGFVLAPALEHNLRDALHQSQGDWGVFVTQPVAAGLLAAAALMIVVAMLPSIGKRRAETSPQD